MVNLNRQRIVVYLYFLIVFTLIFGLSFTVKGDKITGNFVFEIGSFVNNMVSFSFILILFGFLLSLAFSFFVIRHAQEVKKEIHSKKIKPIASIVLILLIFSFLGFGVYNENKREKLTGFVIHEVSTEDDARTKTQKTTPQKLTNTDTYQATSILLKLTLGKFADAAVSDYCKAQYDSSDYAGGTSTGSYSNSQSAPVSGQPQQATSNCAGEQTTLTAQAQQTILPTGFTYQTSWTITPCKENLQYTIYLANSVDDRIGIATGVANKGTTKSESKQFSYAKNYQFICIQVSDTSVGDDGYACFNVV